MAPHNHTDDPVTVMTIVYYVQPDKTAEFLAHVKNFILDTLRVQPECLEIDVLESIQTPGTIIITEAWSVDLEDMQAIMREKLGKEGRVFHEKIGPLQAKPRILEYSKRRKDFYLYR